MSLRFALCSFPERVLSDAELSAALPVMRSDLTLIRRIHAVARQIQLEVGPAYHDWAWLSHKQHRCAVLLTMRAWMRLRSVPHDN
jgi:hypothetical protein